ncbi:MAG: EpsD family peptidyl-prolyl cis-trans isomerase [Polaromonas sp.]|nr:EpsD family peptidyl-prolyl cis-trans isomerase [Polaromonas sp.]
MKILIKKITLLLALVAMTLLISGCLEKDTGKSVSQVAVKVGSEEITINQINDVLSRSPSEGITPDAKEIVSNEILEKLIDQQLAVNKAIEDKLHRTPEIIAQLEASRKEIIARAYMQKIAGKTIGPTALEIKNYYLENPQLFSERRIFKMQELTVLNSINNIDIIKKYSTTTNSIQEASLWLTKNNIKFETGNSTRSAEQIPLEILGRIQALKDGQSVVIQNPTRVTLLKIESSELIPLKEASANPFIEKYLINKRTGELILSDIKKLRNEIKIEYVGQFSLNKSNAQPISELTSNPPSTTIENKSTLEKGVAGLR